MDFTLARQHGRWLVADNLASLEVRTTIGDSVRIGGVLVPAGHPVDLLPAVYPVAAAPTRMLAGQTSAVVTNAAPVDGIADPGSLTRCGDAGSAAARGRTRTTARSRRVRCPPTAACACRGQPIWRPSPPSRSASTRIPPSPSPATAAASTRSADRSRDRDRHDARRRAGSLHLSDRRMGAPRLGRVRRRRDGARGSLSRHGRPDHVEPEPLGEHRGSRGARHPRSPR